VARSEQIVVGHLKLQSIKYVEHPNGPQNGVSGENTVTLVITSVLRGDLKVGEIPLTIHYGLSPVEVGPDDPRAKESLGAIQILDSGSSAAGPHPVVEDARTDHLWFLRKRGHQYGREIGAGNWGVVDPEDISSLALKDVYLAYLTENPEARLETLSAGDPSLRKRSEKFLRPPELKDILRESHPYIRAELLLMFLIKRYPHRGEERIREELAQAEITLLQMLAVESQLKTLRGDVIAVWGNLKYKPGLNFLIELLHQQEEYWVGQELTAGWLDTDIYTFPMQKRVYGEARCAVAALRKIGDPASGKQLEATRKHWLAQKAAGEEMVRECDAALRALAGK
jgi:hypothetical protein